MTIIVAILPGLVFAQQRSWQDDWSAILEAARKEGRVVLAGSPDPNVRVAIPAKFKEKFGITVEYIGARQSEVAARARAEQRAGLYTIDVFLTGIQTAATILYPEKMLDPLRPALILPEVVAPSKWKRGKLWFVDPEDRYVLRLFNSVARILFVNTRYAKPEEFRSLKDLLHPKWKGKISARDPTSPGSGSVSLLLEYGEEFVRKLFIDQDPMLSRDYRQLADWLARGTYPISLDPDSSQVKRLQEEGFPIAILYSLPQTPGTVSMGSGGLALLRKAPHPNAARALVNWMASGEGIELLSRAERRATMRNDVDESFLERDEIPRAGLSYFDDADWEFTATGKEKARLRIRELLKAR